MGIIAFQMEIIALQGYTKNVFYIPGLGQREDWKLCGGGEGEEKQKINDEYYQGDNSENTSKINNVL